MPLDLIKIKTKNEMENIFIPAMIFIAFISLISYYGGYLVGRHMEKLRKPKKAGDKSA